MGILLVWKNLWGTIRLLRETCWTSWQTPYSIYLYLLSLQKSIWSSLNKKNTVLMMLEKRSMLPETSWTLNWKIISNNGTNSCVWESCCWSSCWGNIKKWNSSSQCSNWKVAKLTEHLPSSSEACGNLCTTCATLLYCLITISFKFLILRWWPRYRNRKNKQIGHTSNTHIKNYDNTHSPHKKVCLEQLEFKGIIMNDIEFLPPSQIVLTFSCIKI